LSKGSFFRLFDIYIRIENLTIISNYTRKTSLKNTTCWVPLCDLRTPNKDDENQKGSVSSSLAIKVDS
jgi:hypothetical protein